MAEHTYFRVEVLHPGEIEVQSIKDSFDSYTKEILDETFVDLKSEITSLAQNLPSQIGLPDVDIDFLSDTSFQEFANLDFSSPCGLMGSVLSQLLSATGCLSCSGGCMAAVVCAPALAGGPLAYAACKAGMTSLFVPLLSKATGKLFGKVLCDIGSAPKQRIGQGIKAASCLSGVDLERDIALGIGTPESIQIAVNKNPNKMLTPDSNPPTSLNMSGCDEPFYFHPDSSEAIAIKSVFPLFYVHYLALTGSPEVATIVGLQEIWSISKRNPIEFLTNLKLKLKNIYESSASKQAQIQYRYLKDLHTYYKNIRDVNPVYTQNLKMPQFSDYFVGNKPANYLIERENLDAVISSFSCSHIPTDMQSLSERVDLIHGGRRLLNDVQACLNNQFLEHARDYYPEELKEALLDPGFLQWVTVVETSKKLKKKFPWWIVILAGVTYGLYRRGKNRALK